MSKRLDIFNTVRTEGGILPPELLQKIFNGDSSLDGLKPEDYHLSPSERLNEAATRSWLRLTALWKTFKDNIEKLPLDAVGTTETREHWLLPLFQELGYGRLQSQKAVEIDGKTYPISHKANEPVAIHLVSFKWDLDKRNPIAKGETRLSPHALMQEFLNRSDDYLWGFISNGYKLRVLRDNVSLTRSAYLEFDLQAMMDGDAYSDFFLLFLLCHQSRVEILPDETGKTSSPFNCWLEKWYNTSINEGVRALDDLRNNVKEAITALGTGFIANPANSELRDKLRLGSLSKQDYYHQVLLQVYRLLFIFVAEDRELLLPNDISDAARQNYLKFYSTYRIRELARRKRGSRHTDLWQQLKIVFNGLYEGNPFLGLTPLGSFLFNPNSTPDLSACEITNYDLLSSFRYLCYTQKNNFFQPINYRNLGSEELGSVYEALLEMHPDINLASSSFSLNLIAGSERKTTGSYYTPSSLVDCLLDSALEPVIDNALKSVSSSVTEYAEIQSQKEKALLSLKICDPACGSGHFLVSAAHRLAKRLAALRAGEDEPTPSLIQHALRDVIGHCLYGVDLNPMAVELCKISLWMEALEPGKPLTFLDHHIQCGNSLLGCTPALLKKGIPDAAFTPLTGDDKNYCSKYKKQNREERDKDVLEIFGGDYQPWNHLGNHAAYLINLNQMDDGNIEALHQKEAAYAEVMQSSGYLYGKFIYDSWCAAFVLLKSPANNLPYPITQQILARIENNPYSISPDIRQEVIRLAQEYKFFHWHIAFPDVFQAKLPNEIKDDDLTGWTGGFDCVLGNPPWEHNELKEQEWFTSRDEEISMAEGSKRKKLIDSLQTNNPQLYDAYQDALRYYHATSLLFSKDVGIYPLCGRGRINTYSIFAELNRKILSPTGYCGCIIPSGIATDDTNKFFFRDLFDTGSLVSLYDFENREKLFPAIHSSFKFCLLTMRGLGLKAKADKSKADFFFFALSVADLKDSERHFQLSKEDLALINPNTRTCPIFRSRRDAELTIYIYRRVPVLINENDPVNGNPWGISFKQGLFNMTSDSHLFKTRQDLEDLGYELQGNHFHKENRHFLPLYEAKMIHHFDYRWANADDTEDVTPIQKRNGNFEVMPRYWVNIDDIPDDVLDKSCLFGFRNITNATNERTLISSALPVSAVGNTFILIKSGKYSILPMFICNANSYSTDYIVRQKMGGIHISYFIAEQLPILPPETYANPECLLLGNFLNASVLELLYTSYSLKPFAEDCGYDGPPFIWDDERRFNMRCELDALYFHLYLGSVSEWQSRGSKELLSYFPTPRHAVEYIMETFPIVKRKDEKEYGEYRTKLRILEIYDQMTHCLETNTPFQSTLNPPPGPPSDPAGNFIPVSQWDPEHWPEHIHHIDRED